VPLERVSKGFKDISATFQISPINSDLISLKNANAIARSVRNLVFTVPGDKPFQPTVGSRVSELLFENFDKLTATSIRSEIENTINQYEPRVKLNEVIVEPDFDSYEFNVTIKYFIVGIDIPVQQLTFILEPTR
jgi:phage baseplate assembly protein W